MKYIYDIYLNFNDVIYDFYDWNKNDKLVHIKKIPIFKINVDNFKNIYTHNIKINDEYLKYVHNKAEIYGNSKKELSCALISDGKYIFALLFNKNGISVNRSFLMIDEELEILEELYDDDEINICYKCLNKIEYQTHTRKQIKDEKFIKNELHKMDNNRLKYIYYECFEKQENNIQKIIKKIRNIKQNSKTYEKLYNVLKITSTSSNKML